MLAETMAVNADVEALLTEANLPVSDLCNSPHLGLLGVHEDGRLVGVVGVEIYEKIGMLRSLAVAAERRNAGLGAKLLADAERWAGERGVTSLYLLTTSAAGFFGKLGYQALPRAEAPAAIAATAEFSVLCPASARLMHKTLVPHRASPPDETEVVTASTSDRGPMVTTIVLAFSTDPMARWCWPSAEKYLAAMPSFIEAFGGQAFESGGAHCTSDRCGAALWLPPGRSLDPEKMGGVVEEWMPGEVRNDIYSLMGRMGELHPDEAHWYLPMIGVDPARQGRGYGSALLGYALRQCDRDGCLAYLESSNPRNIPLYERHGFRIIGTFQAGSSPTMVAMLRTPLHASGHD